MTTKPFHEVIKALTRQDVIPVPNLKACTPVVQTLEGVAESVADGIKVNPIERPRSNEVGHDVKKRVSNVLGAEKAVNIMPITNKAGYPDFKICIEDEIIFLVCKTFRSDQINKSMRRFYCSDGPSIREKIRCTAAHILMSFEMENQRNLYTPVSYRLVDLYDLPCTLKKEWNSDNKQLYAKNRILVNKTV